MGVRVTGLVILALGFVASASAVVPGFERLVHGSRLYLAVTSVLGLGALVAGLVTLWSSSTAAHPTWAPCRIGRSSRSAQWWNAPSARPFGQV